MKAEKTELESHERDLFRRAQRGDRAAFRDIYELYRDRVFRLVFYSLNERALAEDVSQTVFLKIYRALASFRFEAEPATWIYRIALNECMNQNRRHSPKHVPIESILGSGEEIDCEAPPDDRQARGEIQRVIQRTVIDLPPKLRSVVILKYVEGLSYDEMSRVLECPPGTIASRLNRALAELEARLRPLRRLL